MKRRNITDPRRKPSASKDATENLINATYGELRDSKGAMLFQFLNQIANRKPDPLLCQCFVQELVELLRASDGQPLRDLAAMIESPIASPVLERAFSIAYRLSLHARGGNCIPEDAAARKAMFKRIAKERGCSVRQVERVLTAKPPMPELKRADIIRAIMDPTGCNERTATKAMATAGIPQLMKWQRGRKPSRPRTQ